MVRENSPGIAAVMRAAPGNHVVPLAKHWFGVMSTFAPIASEYHVK
jgi:hypothetical protein